MVHQHAADIHPDAYGVVICDEAHTALGERTAATIRRFSRPTYIGMTATDQLLQKHVGDVFPAEVADFPLADAVRRGVVAPLRALRVKPGASLRNVPIVGGDYDQRALAEALDHEALNMAAAMLYRDLFDHRAGIVYAAGVDHAERVAAAMRAAGLRARSVSGRTPPRALAATLAAYERGDINVLVNAQLLAEGWNAPRATVCMHLAPTASRRVYQQRIGRVMRLHRRKEAGVVVDFVDPAAPHSDRTVTLHCLLDVDLYQPGALVTPKLAAPPAALAPPGAAAAARRRVADPRDRRPRPAARRHRRALEDRQRRPPAARRAGVLGRDRRAARRTGRPAAARRDAREGRRETRIRFFATCAAECKHRSLRLIALADLAAHRPDINTIDRMVRLIEAAPTWASDRAQGARVLLLAIAAGSLPGSQSQRLTWTWKLARASRETQYRAATAASPAIRDLLRTLASSRGEEHHVRARLLVASLRQAELPVAAAALAAALTHDAIAARTIETARAELGAGRRGAGRRVRQPTCPSRRPIRPPRRAARARSARTGPAGAPAAQAAANGKPRRGQAPAAAGAGRRRREPGRPRPTALPRASAAVVAVAARARARAAHANGAGQRRSARERVGARRRGEPAAQPAPAGAREQRSSRPANAQRAGAAAKPKPRPRRRKRAVMDAASIGLPPKGEDG